MEQETDKVGKLVIWETITSTANISYIIIAVADLLMIMTGNSIVAPLISFVFLMVMICMDIKAGALALRDKWDKVSKVVIINEIIYYASIAFMLVGLYINYYGGSQ